MKREDIEALLDEEGAEFRFEIDDFEDSARGISVGGKIALPLASVSTDYKTDSATDVLDDNGRLLGVLCVFDSLKEYSLHDLTDEQYAAYVKDASLEQYESPHRFSRSYFVSHSDVIEEYITDYSETAALWGGFEHLLDEGDDFTCHKRGDNPIQAKEGVEYPSKFHHQIAFSSTLQASAFERFLKLYHLIELLFDYSIVTKIKGLDSEDFTGFGQIMSSYSSRELPRLKTILKESIDSPEDIAELMVMDQSCQDIARKLFYSYGKDGNPMKEEANFQALCDSSYLQADATRVVGKVNANTYPEFIADLSAYWIYRIRCSIAHSRIGEYIFDPSEEFFIVDFAEPLIRGILFQTLAKS